MPKATRTVRVQEIPGEPWCFHVESWSRPQQPHRVELLAQDGFGECSCTSWGTRKWPAIRDKTVKVRGTKATECRHVEAARVYKWNQQMRDLAAREAACA
jgi:hypothetical protein